MPRVELVYASACPNVKATRTALVSAFVEAGVVPRWSEHGVEDPRTPEALRGYGSPAILVDGRHVLGATKENGPSCRLFFDAAGKVATSPSVAAIAAALRAATAVTSAQAPRTWRSSLAVLPGIGGASSQAHGASPLQGHGAREASGTTSPRVPRRLFDVHPRREHSRVDVVSQGDGASVSGTGRGRGGVRGSSWRVTQAAGSQRRASA
jgi:hypothetical protein